MPEVVFSTDSKDDLKSIVRFTRKKWSKEQAVDYVGG
jgi:plasmid stabilization system protein ParE